MFTTETEINWRPYENGKENGTNEAKKWRKKRTLFFCNMEFVERSENSVLRAWSIVVYWCTSSISSVEFSIQSTVRNVPYLHWIRYTRERERDTVCEYMRVRVCVLFSSFVSTVGAEREIGRGHMESVEKGSNKIFGRTNRTPDSMWNERKIRKITTLKSKHRQEYVVHMACEHKIEKRESIDAHSQQSSLSLAIFIGWYIITVTLINRRGCRLLSRKKTQSRNDVRYNNAIDSQSKYNRPFLNRNDKCEHNAAKHCRVNSMHLFLNFLQMCILWGWPIDHWRKMPSKGLSTRRTREQNGLEQKVGKSTLHPFDTSHEHAVLTSIVYTAPPYLIFFAALEMGRLFAHKRPHRMDSEFTEIIVIKIVWKWKIQWIYAESIGLERERE